MWNVQPTERYNWDWLRAEIMKYGVRNSLLTGCMPTASTAQIMGNCELFEPFTSNLYSRSVKAGEFVIINKYMVEDLKKLNKWTYNLKQQIVKDNGSVQNLNIPNNLKILYKTIWEMKQRTLIDLSIGRGPYICQTQSLNLYFKTPTVEKLSASMFYAWQKGLKTGSYYIRSNPDSSAQQFTVDPSTQNIEPTHTNEHSAPSQLSHSHKSESYLSGYTGYSILPHPPPPPQHSEQENQVVVIPKKYICTDEICTSCQ
jgi:ribonucleoside-diphosphate reductase alpha chain